MGLSDEADGEIVAGVVYDPLRDDMFVAEKGRGAWLNGRQIKVSKIRDVGGIADSDRVSQSEAP